MSANPTRRDRSQDGWTVERLEQRIVLAAAHDLAVVGLAYDSDVGYAPYLQELVWAEDRSITGSSFVPGAAGPDGPTPTNITDLIHGPSGMVRPFFETPQFPTDSYGARFLPEDGYPLGWFGGSDAAESQETSDIAAVIERSPDATAADLTGSWSIQFTQITPGGVFTRHGQVTFNSGGGFFGLAFGGSGDSLFIGEGFDFAGDPVNGRFDVGMGNGDTGIMYLSKDKSVLLFADLDDTGGDSWMGIGVRQGFSLIDADVVGSYRTGVMFDGDDVRTNFGDAPAAWWQVDVDSDGTFTIQDVRDLDRGTADQFVSTGTWTHDSGVLTLTDATTGLQTVLKLNENGFSAMVIQFAQPEQSISERPMGFATKIAADADTDLGTVFSSGVLGADGLPVVFDLRAQTDSWSVVDLARYGMPDLDNPSSEIGASPGDVESFQATDGRLMAVVTTDDTLLAFERDDSGFWRTTDLRRSIDSAETITSTITVYTTRDGVSVVAGLTGAGDVVTYDFDPTADGGAGRWGFNNISVEYLTPQGEATPVFVGPLMSYVTSWNGLNIAGLAADGSIQAVWSGNGGVAWHAANLSLITGAPPLTSGLTAYLTSWGGINIVGLDGGGQVLATWWVPGFGGVWKVSNLTTIAGGPTLTGDSVTSFFAPWGALNIAGIDASGDVRAYWWTPSTDEWQVANLTASIPDGQPKPSQQLHGQSNTTHGGELNILGTDPDTGDLLRLFFRVDADVWAVQNLTVEADFV